MENISPALLNWFYENQRVLPFRTDPSPYHVWLSEIMLQQTRVSAALGIHGITEAKPIPKAKHIFSHIEWRMTGYTVTVEAQPAPDGCIWATREQLQTEYTLPGAFKAYKKRLGLV